MPPTKKRRRGEEESIQPPLPDEPLPSTILTSGAHDRTLAPPLPHEPLPSDATLAQEAPPLPDEPLPEALDEETAPPLPDEPLPTTEGDARLAEEVGDDGWEAIYDAGSGAYYFHNARTGVTTWDNPRITTSTHPSLAPAQADHSAVADSGSVAGDKMEERPIVVKARFDRFGRMISDPTRTPENYTADARAERQLAAFYNTALTSTNSPPGVGLGAGAGAVGVPGHDGRSLKQERRDKRYSRQELREFKLKYKEKKELKRRAWLTEESDKKRRG